MTRFLSREDAVKVWQEMCILRQALTEEQKNTTVIVLLIDGEEVERRTYRQLESSMILPDYA